MYALPPPFWKNCHTASAARLLSAVSGPKFAVKSSHESTSSAVASGPCG